MKVLEYFELLKKEPGYKGVFRLMEQLGHGAAYELHSTSGITEVTYPEYLGLIDETARRMREYFQSDAMRQLIAQKERTLDPDDPGKRGWVGIQLQNSPSFGICFWAAMASGHPVALIDP